ncbi:Protein real-time [Mycena kentingensis (nom. inval.)]|nr:Protein real-time [Mycena kentingensis (nom. inval.)]
MAAKSRVLDLSRELESPTGRRGPEEPEDNTCLRITAHLHLHPRALLRVRRMDLLLQANREKSELFDVQYTESLDAVRELQTTLLQDILPSVADELDLSEGDGALEWAREWLRDTCTIFRILRRNKFTRSFALESIRKTLLWRLTHLYPPAASSASASPAQQQPQPPLVQCLPLRATDPFGRPILVIKVVSFNDSGSSDAYKPLLLRGLERLRLHLRRLNESEGGRGRGRDTPIMQYVMLLDLKNLSTQSLNIDLVTWTLREAIPHFPGMLAAAFMINYSWAHAGIWGIAKRVMPAPALARIFFPTQQEVVGYFSAGTLPSDYGGTLPSLEELLEEDPLRDIVLDVDKDYEPIRRRSPPLANGSAHELPASLPATPNTSSAASLPKAPSSILLHPTSLLNPFFGYPTSLSFSRSSSESTHTHHPTHGRRRKRDLVRTLLVLAWQRWRGRLWTLVALALVVAVVVAGAGRGRRRRVVVARVFERLRLLARRI